MSFIFSFLERVLVTPMVLETDNHAKILRKRIITSLVFVSVIAYFPFVVVAISYDEKIFPSAVAISCQIITSICLYVYARKQKRIRDAVLNLYFFTAIVAVNVAAIIMEEIYIAPFAALAILQTCRICHLHASVIVVFIIAVGVQIGNFIEIQVKGPRRGDSTLGDPAVTTALFVAVLAQLGVCLYHSPTHIIHMRDQEKGNYVNLLTVQEVSKALANFDTDEAHARLAAVEPEDRTPVVDSLSEVVGNLAYYKSYLPRALFASTEANHNINNNNNTSSSPLFDNGTDGNSFASVHNNSSLVRRTSTSRSTPRDSHISQNRGGGGSGVITIAGGDATSPAAEGVADLPPTVMVNTSLVPSDEAAGCSAPAGQGAKDVVAGTSHITRRASVMLVSFAPPQTTLLHLHGVEKPLIHDHLATIQKIVSHHRGVVDLVTDRTIMVTFGAHFTLVLHEEVAVQCALQLLSSTQGCGDEPVSERVAASAAGIAVAVASGTVSIGNIGTTEHKRRLVGGDVVSIVHSISTLQQQIHSRLLVADSTARQITQYGVIPVDIIRVGPKAIASSGTRSGGGGRGANRGRTPDITVFEVVVKVDSLINTNTTPHLLGVLGGDSSENNIAVFSVRDDIGHASSTTTTNNNSNPFTQEYQQPPKSQSVLIADMKKVMALAARGDHHTALAILATHPGRFQALEGALRQSVASASNNNNPRTTSLHHDERGAIVSSQSTPYARVPRPWLLTRGGTTSRDTSTSAAQNQKQHQLLSSQQQQQRIGGGTASVPPLVSLQSLRELASPARSTVTGPLHNLNDSIASSGEDVGGGLHAAPQLAQMMPTAMDPIANNPNTSLAHLMSSGSLFQAGFSGDFAKMTFGNNRTLFGGDPSNNTLDRQADSIAYRDKTLTCMSGADFGLPHPPSVLPLPTTTTNTATANNNNTSSLPPVQEEGEGGHRGSTSTNATTTNNPQNNNLHHRNSSTTGNGTSGMTVCGGGGDSSSRGSVVIGSGGGVGCKSSDDVIAMCYANIWKSSSIVGGGVDGTDGQQQQQPPSSAATFHFNINNNITTTTSQSLKQQQNQQQLVRGYNPCSGMCGVTSSNPFAVNSVLLFGPNGDLAQAVTVKSSDVREKSPFLVALRKYLKMNPEGVGGPGCPPFHLLPPHDNVCQYIAVFTKSYNQKPASNKTTTPTTTTTNEVPQLLVTNVAEVGEKASHERTPTSAFIDIHQQQEGLTGGEGSTNSQSSRGLDNTPRTPTTPPSILVQREDDGTATNTISLQQQQELHQLQLLHQSGSFKTTTLTTSTDTSSSANPALLAMIASANSPTSTTLAESDSPPFAMNTTTTVTNNTNNKDTAANTTYTAAPAAANIIDIPPSTTLMFRFISGGNVLAMLKDLNGRIPVTAWQNYLRDVVAGVTFLHSNRVVHGCVQPTNVLLNSDGMCLISEYGGFYRWDTAPSSQPYLAPEFLFHQGGGQDEGKLLSTTHRSTSTTVTTSSSSAAAASSSVTTTGPTPPHPPPPPPPPTMAGDIWSIGMTALHLYLGDLPFKSLSGYERYQALAAAAPDTATTATRPATTPTTPSSPPTARNSASHHHHSSTNSSLMRVLTNNNHHNPAAPPHVVQFITSCLQLDPSQRINASALQSMAASW